MNVTDRGVVTADGTDRGWRWISSADRLAWAPDGDRTAIVEWVDLQHTRVVVEGEGTWAASDVPPGSDAQPAWRPVPR